MSHTREMGQEHWRSLKQLPLACRLLAMAETEGDPRGGAAIICVP